MSRLTLMKLGPNFSSFRCRGLRRPTLDRKPEARLVSLSGGQPVERAYMPAAEDLSWSPLLDVNQRPMLELLASGDTVLARCVDRLIKSLDDPDGIISAFQNYAS
jgi:hypothetical protein